MNISKTNKRILSNTVFLYIRLLFLMLVSFYTYRLLLRELGVVDYGVYAVVGSVVSIFSSIKGLLSSATQRFLNYEMGNENFEKLREIFSTSILIHFMIAILFVVLVEVVGLWYIANKLVIPPDRLNAAYWVFHFSVLTTVVSIMTVPFDSVIIANEKMKVFAFIAILDGFLKLGVIGILVLTSLDKLILYALLLLVVAFIIRFISSIYCQKNFPEAKFKFIVNLKLFKEMGSFAGWQFLGNTSFAIQNQGLNMVLNFFFGPVLNATRGIVMQANAALQAFVQNALIAVNPQIVKLYAAKKKSDMLNLFFMTSKFSFLFFLFISFPVFLLADELLQVWLVDVPKYTTIFLKLTLIYTLVRVFHNPIDSIIKATGRIKFYQLVDSFFLFITLPITIILFIKGHPPYIMFIVMAVLESVNLIVIINIAARLINFSIIDYFKHVILPSLYVALIAMFLYFVFINIIIESFLIKVSVAVGFLFMLLLMTWGFNLKNQERDYIKAILRNKFLRK